MSPALARLEAWLATMRCPGGYGGPAIGFRGVGMAYCGPGHDWRWEGLLDGWAERHARTGDPVFMDCIEQALQDLVAAQLRDGTFRNSSFELNPGEGGLPHEPAMMAAATRACGTLARSGRPLPAGTEAMIRRFVEDRLIRELWNKQLRTFNSWLQSDFESYAPPAVAAILEVLLAYGDLTGESARLEPYVRGAAESLLACQPATGGLLAGGMPIANRKDAPVSPLLAARCLPALVAMHRRTGEARWAAAAEALAGFLARTAVPGGGFPFLAHARRPAEAWPVFVGATAGVLVALNRADRLTDADVAAHLPFLLARQAASGGFETACGHGHCPRPARRPDWRDVMPVTGWAGMIYHLLAILDADATAPSIGDVGEVHCAVTILGATAEFHEDTGAMRLAGKGRVWFEWSKGKPWPKVCELS